MLTVVPSPSLLFLSNICGLAHSRVGPCHLQQPAQLPEGCDCCIRGDQNHQVYQEGEWGWGDSTGRGLHGGWDCWEHQCSWSLPLIPAQAEGSGAGGDGFEVPRERADNLVLLHAHCLVLLQVQIDPYLEDSMCQVCNAQPGPFFCRDQVRQVLLWPVLTVFLEEKQALLLGFGDVYTGSAPAGKMGPSWEGGLVLEEVQPSWGGQLWYVPGGPGRQCPTGFEPEELQFTGAVSALGT